MKHTLTIILLIITNYFFAQNILYVEADNGLNVREKPQLSSKKIGKLDYSTAVKVFQNTGLELTIKDEGKDVTGEWVEVHEINGDLKGYVFNGFLTSTELNSRIDIKFKGFSLQMELEVWDEDKNLEKVKKDRAMVDVELGDSPEQKEIKIKHSKFKNIEVFQRYRNNITIMNEGPHCDLTEWKHYDSNWKKLDYNSKQNTFTTVSYDENDRNKFLNVDLNDLKQAVNNACGENWAALLKDVKKLDEYPIGISISKIYLKIVLTKKDNTVIEKIVVFKMPMGC